MSAHRRRASRLTISEQRGHRTPRKDIDIVLEASAIKDHQRRQAGDSSRQSHDIEEQETGVDLASKLLQIVSIVNYAWGGQELFYGFESAARNGISLYAYRRGSISGPPISAYKFKPPA